MLGVCMDYKNKNYGSKLQALATVRMFEELSLDYEIIRYNKRTPKFILKYLLRFFNIVFLNDRYDQVQRIIEYRRHPGIKKLIDIRNAEMDSMDSGFDAHLSELYPSYGALKRHCPERYDRLITCSDQLWSPSALGSGFYNLMFADEDMPKVSWASSFGVSRIPWYQIGRTRTYLNRIQNISMRENRGAQIVEELTGKKVPVLMDPVFVFDRAAWDKIIPPENPEWGDYVFCYFLGDNQEHRARVKHFASEKGLKIVTLRHLDRYIDKDEGFGDIAPYDVSPARFLNILRNARYVCTDSFHGTAFSVIFEKPFAVFDRYSDRSSNSKNSRIDSLCENLGLENQRCRGNEMPGEILEQDINYEKVGEKLSHYRSATRRFPKENLT